MHSEDSELRSGGKVPSATSMDECPQATRQEETDANLQVHAQAQSTLYSWLGTANETLRMGSIMYSNQDLS